jgi:hypothetical protein
MAMRLIFLCFCINRFGRIPLHCSIFGFEFTEIFVIKKRLPDSPSWRLSDSASLGVVNSLRLAESGVAMVSRVVTIRIFLNLSSIYITLNG